MPRYSDYEYDRYDDAMSDALSDELEERLDELREEHPDADEDELREILMDEEDRCRCSDPGCPCDGPKRCGPP